ncbi:hypothetical protein N8793_05835 [Pseudomonadales bacterium]|nr:hypothetical protein [Pseudomonadales bacterium]
MAIITNKKNHQLGLVALLFALVGMPISVMATTITLNNSDDANEGLNDPTPSLPIGGNIGNTVGQQRVIVFEYAAALVASVINSTVPISIEAKFDPLTCDATSGILGLAGPNGFHQNFLGTPLSNTFYSQAQANSLSGADLNPSTDDMGMTFNSSVDNNSGCLDNRNWYYGLDGNPPSNDIDFLTTVLHEVMHGIGFLTRVNLTSGAKQSGSDDAYMLNIEDHSLGKIWPNMTNSQRAASAKDDPDLHFIGNHVQNNLGGLTDGINQGHARLYAPSTLSTFSSVSHFSNAFEPFQLMEHQQTGTASNIGLATYVLADMGWSIQANQETVISTIDNQLLRDIQTLTVNFTVMDNDTDPSSLSIVGNSSNTTVVSNNNIVLSGTGRLRTLNIAPNLNSTGSTIITLTADDGSTPTSAIDFILEVTDDLPPETTISSPAENAIFYSAPQSLTATASDFEQGDLSGSVSWNSSIDGPIGSGAAINPSLSDGVHLITASVTDNSGQTGLDMITLVVDLTGDADSDGLANAVEISLGLDPENADSDEDFMSDFIEVNRDGDPSNYTPGIDTDPNDSDTDNDGVLDGADYAPLDPDAGSEAVPILPLIGFAALASLLTLIIRQRHSAIATASR